MSVIAIVLQRIVRAELNGQRIPLHGGARRIPGASRRAPLRFPEVFLKLQEACKSEGVGDEDVLRNFGDEFMPRVAKTKTRRAKRHRRSGAYMRSDPKWDLFKRLLRVVDEHGRLYMEDVVNASVAEVTRYVQAVLERDRPSPAGVQRTKCEVRKLFRALGREDVVQEI